MRRRGGHHRGRPECDGGGEIRIRFDAAPEEEAGHEYEEDQPYAEEDEYDDRGNSWQNRYELIRSLQRAGRREGFEFVSLKWFRDLFLPAEQYAWTDSLEARSREIGDAIDEGAILTYKVPNTRSPEFPVTAIRLNHEHPDVRAVLGEAPSRSGGLQPVGLRGQHLFVHDDARPALSRPRPCRHGRAGELMRPETGDPMTADVSLMGPLHRHRQAQQAVTERPDLVHHAQRLLKPIVRVAIDVDANLHVTDLDSLPKRAL